MEQQEVGAIEATSDLGRELGERCRALGPDYRPRTRHRYPDGRPRYINRLIRETSPYLLQHAHNPVSWYAWGEEAFAEARARGRPILLSVGYSTCHWCHVMEEESFEDEEIAAFINHHFVPVKVDREERPDVDSVYMAAVQVMNRGGGGWPMTVVMTASGQPFFGGTYFPPRDGARGARVGFLTVLQRLAEIHSREPERVLASAAELSRALIAHAATLIPQGLPRAEVLADAAQQLCARFDPRWGGFGHAPKFPRPSAYEFLLRYHRRTQDAASLQVVRRSLTGMLEGGLWDQLGGGFHRYSTDERWLVPHFEKMLYDNAQLVVLLLEAHQVLGEPRFARAARECLDYVLREMTHPQGGFYSATDADSEGEEGLFFVWTPSQLEEVLGPRAAKIVGAFWGVSAAGNFEGRSILHRLRPLAEVAAELKLSPEEVQAEVERARPALYAARARRVPPLRDEKILTEWNAQMISAFAAGSFVLGERRYLEAALSAREFRRAALERDGRLRRSWRGELGPHAAVLEDYAYVIASELDLFEVTGRAEYLVEARRLQSLADELFWDPAAGGYFGTTHDAERLLFREKPGYDGAQPAGNSVAAQNLLRLAEITADPAARKRAEEIFRLFAQGLERGAIECPKLASALDCYWDQVQTVVLVRSSTDPGTALTDVVRQSFLPNRALIQVEEGPALEALAAQVPALGGKRALEGRATAYVCVEGVCAQPARTPEQLRLQLAPAQAGAGPTPPF